MDDLLSFSNTSNRVPGPPPIPACKWCGVPVRPTGGCNCKPGEGRYEPQRVRDTELLGIVRQTIKAVVRARESGAWGSVAGGSYLDQIRKREEHLLEKVRG